ncbi:MAG: hypothetical protein DLM53_09290 [Candidatus Eremiobacter antarcticus]|nr:hypothetical protein [Candidatus Eremiobacteraeota bacterium]PZR61413.1 MAG: hypothetical protein DLM53_09290 [Candidatus Eremiobacter sp. RRmetagenome_bin22]
MRQALNLRDISDDSLPSTQREPAVTATKRPLHRQTLGAAEAAKKRLRLSTLEERSRNNGERRAALERRTAREAARLDQLVIRRETTRLRFAPPTIDQRRVQYTAECEQPKSRSSRLFATSVLATLALPLLIAVATNFARVPLHASVSKAHKHSHLAIVRIRVPAATQRPVYFMEKNIAAKKRIAASPAPTRHQALIAVTARPAPSPVEPAAASPTVLASPILGLPLSPAAVATPATRIIVPASPAAPVVESSSLRLTAHPLGPHLMALDWTEHPRATKRKTFTLYRSSADGGLAQMIAHIPSYRHSYRDKAVNGSALYRYVIVAGSDAESASAATGAVVTPPEVAAPTTGAEALAGKGMFLYFSSRPTDAHSYSRLDPRTIADAARNAGISFIELRMSRGAKPMADTPGSRAWLDRLIDASAEADIKLLAWTVPRAVTAQDIAQSLAMARYRTPAGNGFIGLALDLESGDQYMGHGRAARNGMVAYINAIRNAVGSHYLLVATVASPHSGHLTNDDVPYARIAAYADVLQPMEYWHYFNEGARHEYGRGEVALASSQAVLRTRELAGRDIPVNLAGQSVDLESTGSPSGREIMWSLGAAKSVGALGETFFDLTGTKPDAWAAIQAFEW